MTERKLKSVRKLLLGADNDNWTFLAVTPSGNSHHSKTRVARVAALAPIPTRTSRNTQD